MSGTGSAVLATVAALMLLAAARCVFARRDTPQGRTWLMLGMGMAAIALWLRHSAGMT